MPPNKIKKFKQSLKLVLFYKNVLLLHRQTAGQLVLGPLLVNFQFEIAAKFVLALLVSAVAGEPET